ncbi:MAG: peptidase [Novosphingobium lindaniclasticum]|jgi:predicted Zn-dependent protease|uniref:M48 family metallopeptidase n=1 Tax=Novosphingobium lindaniclasticum TaxID=1329895 RepID=UPI002409A3F4|nr:M48 family metallopeptidase [Novosphingobium lindaniclasticum]MDF2637951.1 peptidase [Novosphingobium lindaniclasticum]
MRRSLALIVSALVALAGTTAHAVDPSLALPPFSPAYEPTNVDERGLWMQADEIERRLRDSHLRIRDGNLEQYLLGVLCREVGQERCAGVRLYAIEDPQFNASMMPNGAMQVQSGLLLRVRNEGELAAVLGHEFAHFELRHGLNGFKNRRAGSDVMAWISVLGGITNTPTGSTQLSIAGSIFKFNRDQETAADMLGLRYTAQSGYPAHSASEIWQSLMAEQEATARGRKLKANQHFTAGFFDTHPTSLSRSVYLAEAADKMPAGGDPRTQELQAALAPYLPRFLSAQNKLNDFGGTDYILSNLAARGGWTPDLLFARGELYRARANPRDLQLASQFYRDAKTAGYTGAELDRNLGLALIRNGQVDEGRAALSAYLTEAPDASDAAIIHTLMAN